MTALLLPAKTSTPWPGWPFAEDHPVEDRVAGQGAYPQIGHGRKVDVLKLRVVGERVVPGDGQPGRVDPAEVGETADRALVDGGQSRQAQAGEQAVERVDAQILDLGKVDRTQLAAVVESIAAKPD